MYLQKLNPSLLEVGDVVQAESDSPNFMGKEFKVHHIGRFPSAKGTEYKIWLMPRTGKKDLHYCWVAPTLPGPSTIHKCV
jgi:hypothetical protein